jgi:hypothetical protein
MSDDPRFNWQDYHHHQACGRYYGYPECCVEWYARNMAEGVYGLAATYGCIYVGPGKQYVPCPKCADNAIPFEVWCQTLQYETEEERVEFLKGGGYLDNAAA